MAAEEMTCRLTVRAMPHWPPGRSGRNALIMANLSLGRSHPVGVLFFHARAMRAAETQHAFKPGKGKSPYPCPWRGQR